MRLKINTSTREILRADYITGVMTEEYVDVDGGESDDNRASYFGFIHLQNEKD